MKKLLSAFFLTSLLVTLVIPLVVGAADATAPDQCKMGRDVTVGGNVDNGSGICSSGATYLIDSQDSICCIMNTMYNIADWMFVILVGVAGVFIIIGAMNLVMAAGDAAKVKTGRDYIMFAAIGLFIAFIARAIPGLVIMIIGS